MSFRYCPRCATQLEEAHIFGKTRKVCPACNFIHFQDPKVAAATFIERDGEILLIKRGVEPEFGKWALPAGYVNYGEDPEQAAIRETLEETGLYVEITDLVLVMLTEAIKKVILIVYRGRPYSGELNAGDDADEVGWFRLDQLPDIAFESTNRIIDLWRQEQQG